MDFKRQLKGTPCSLADSRAVVKIQSTVQSCCYLKDHSRCLSKTLVTWVVVIAADHHHLIQVGALRPTECKRFEAFEALGVCPIRIRPQVVACIRRKCADNALAAGEHEVAVHELTATGMAIEKETIA